jgi:hypothetical protein
MPVCTVAGATVTIVGVGTCSIIASQAGNSNYSAAPPVSQSFMVNSTATPAISGSNINYAFIWSGATPLAASPVTITSAPSGVSGLALSSSGSCAWLNSSLVGTAAPASLNTSFNTTPLNTLAPGTYVCNLTVSGTGATAAQLTATLTVSAPALFTNEVALGGGVFYLQFPDNVPFGYFSYVSSTFLYHLDMGYESVVSAHDTSNGIYLYDLKSGHWWYTSAALFPYLYDFTLNGFIYYFPSTTNPGHYSTNPRYFVNLTTNQIFTM